MKEISRRSFIVEEKELLARLELPAGEIAAVEQVAPEQWEFILVGEKK